jgi:uncharacterized protein YdhG (YjbR/CyaY superfamily)
MAPIITPDDYIDAQPKEARPFLAQVRGFLRKTVPKQADEVISYQIIAYKHHGMLVGFGMHKIGASFFTMNPVLLTSMKDELGNIDYSGTTIHLDRQKKIPSALLKKIIKIRIAENELRAAMKLNPTKTKSKMKRSK